MVHCGVLISIFYASVSNHIKQCSDLCETVLLDALALTWYQLLLHTMTKQNHAWSELGV